MNESKSLCVIPWLHRFTNEQGRHQVCCTGVGPQNDLHDSWGGPLHVSQGLTDAQLLNSPDLKAIRLAMMRGEWPALCERCERSEEAGAVSVRQHLNLRFGHRSEALLAQTAADGTLSDPLVFYADIRLGNVCNLTCRMCGPVASRLWADHHNNVHPKSNLLPVSELTALRDSNWVKREPVANLIEQCLPSVESLHFAGGEPLIIPEMIDALELCIRSGRAGEIDLSYNTNITVLPERVTQLWPHFRGVSLFCSVDGFGPLNDYIRRPSKWADIDRNLHLLDRNYEAWKLRRVLLCVTVQTYNILQLGELFDYAAQFRRIAPSPVLTPLYHPPYLSIRHLPGRVKSVARERLLAERGKLEARMQSASNSGSRWRLTLIDAAIDYMEEAAEPRKIVDFLYFSEKCDREFGDSWRRACPELAQMLFPAGQSHS